MRLAAFGPATIFSMSEPTHVATAEETALQQALERLLTPLAQLAVARGLAYSVIDETLRRLLVAAAHRAHPSVPAHRRASRISAATGLHRREVNRLLEQATPTPISAPPRSPAAMVFAHWRAHPRYRKRNGQPRPLPRVGAAPSFASLAQEVTRDMHPRALLEELLRLDLATLDAERDIVTLSATAFVPRGDQARMLGYLGANVGDHLQAAVANVLSSEPPHFEQAIAADGLSPASLARLRPLLREHWQRLSDELVPQLERLIEEDAGRDGAAAHRVRLGLFSFDDSSTPPGSAPDDAAPEAVPRRTPDRKTPR